jgi:hypothetical protein
MFLYFVSMSIKEVTKSSTTYSDTKLFDSRTHVMSFHVHNELTAVPALRHVASRRVPSR